MPMDKITFAEKKVYEDGVCTKKHWIALGESAAKEVPEEVYYKLDADEFEKLKNVDISKDTFQDNVKNYMNDSVILNVAQTESKGNAHKVISDFLNDFFNISYDAGYDDAMGDIENLVKTLKNKRSKK
jgi:hypothetical protein